MGEVSREITAVEVTKEFRVCAGCDYQKGFHVSFFPKDDSESLRLVLICPSCGARYDIGKSI